MQPIRALPLLAGLSLATLAASAATGLAADSRITEVTLYPGSATVERVARVPAGARSLRIDCLPGSLDPASLQVAAGAGVRLGETAVRTQQRALVPGCIDDALEQRIRALEDRKAALQAEHGALDLVAGYLKSLGGEVASGQLVGSTADAMRRTGQDALLRQHQLTRAQADIDRELAPLLAERERGQGRGDHVVSVTVTLAAGAASELTLRYQLRGPGWTPAYRAELDSRTRRLRLERRALVAQSSGEDWRGVRLRLSTGQPLRATAGREPTPWRLGIAEPVQPRAESARAVPAPAPLAAAPTRRSAAGARPSAADAAAEAEADVSFDVATDEQAFATEFRVPQPVDVPSSGERVAVVLGEHEDTVELAVRASPQLETAAYLVAAFAPPPGVWPAGQMQLLRDGAFVGSTRWTPPTEAQASLSFGVDERVRVQAEPERDEQGSAGVFGGRTERRVQRTYLVENRHDTPITLEVLEAAPVSVDERVRVQTQFTPEPGERDWRARPGLVLWRMPLAAGQSQRLLADYRIAYPQDERLERR